MAVPLDAAKLLRALEGDRRDHERLMQRARARNEHEEADAAQAVVRYLDGLIGRVKTGAVG